MSIQGRSSPKQLVWCIVCHSKKIYTSGNTSNESGRTLKLGVQLSIYENETRPRSQSLNVNGCFFFVFLFLAGEWAMTSLWRSPDCGYKLHKLHKLHKFYASNPWRPNIPQDFISIPALIVLTLIFTSQTVDLTFMRSGNGLLARHSSLIEQPTVLS